MSRVTWPRALWFAAAMAIGAALGGCQAIVGSGDYAVGTSSEGAGNDSGGGDDATEPQDSGPGSDSGVTPEGGQQTASDGGGRIGDPCQKTSDCPHGAACQGEWCTIPCTANGACGVNSAMQPNYCIANTSGVGKSCAPGCASDSDCAAYPDTACTQIPGGVAYTCVAQSTSDASGTAQIGDPCTVDSDCTAPATCVGTWCSVPCQGSSDTTTCGTNSNLVTNYCVENQANQYICFPGCTTNSDCAYSLPGTTCQPIGSGSSICADPQGMTGDPCSTNSDCTAPDGGAGYCLGIWCSPPDGCTTDSSCGSNTAGQMNFCLENRNNSYVCFPGCTQYADCTVYSGTFCQPIVGSSRGFVCGTTAGGIGDPCLQDSDCTASGATCSIEGWCTQPCTSPTDTSCGTNNENNMNYCVNDPVAGAYQCNPGCSLQTDCISYEYTNCNPIPGQSVSACGF